MKKNELIVHDLLVELFASQEKILEQLSLDAVLGPVEDDAQSSFKRIKKSLAEENFSEANWDDREARLIVEAFREVYGIARDVMRKKIPYSEVEADYKKLFDQAADAAHEIFTNSVPHIKAAVDSGEMDSRTATMLPFLTVMHTLSYFKMSAFIAKQLDNNFMSIEEVDKLFQSFADYHQFNRKFKKPREVSASHLKNGARILMHITK